MPLEDGRGAAALPGAQHIGTSGHGPEEAERRPANISFQARRREWTTRGCLGHSPGARPSHKSACTPTSSPPPRRAHAHRRRGRARQCSRGRTCRRVCGWHGVLCERRAVEKPGGTRVAVAERTGRAASPAQSPPSSGRRSSGHWRGRSSASRTRLVWGRCDDATSRGGVEDGGWCESGERVRESAGERVNEEARRRAKVGKRAV